MTTLWTLGGFCGDAGPHGWTLQARCQEGLEMFGRPPVNCGANRSVKYQFNFTVSSEHSNSVASARMRKNATKDACTQDFIDVKMSKFFRRWISLFVALCRLMEHEFSWQKMEWRGKIWITERLSEWDKLDNFQIKIALFFNEPSTQLRSLQRTWLLCC